MSQSLSQSFTLEVLKKSLNEVFPFIKIVSNKELVQNEAAKIFEKVVKNLSSGISKFIESNINENAADLGAMIKAELEAGTIFDKKSLKHAVEDMIGNKLHVDVKTTTNTEFKISLIDDFKKLSRDALKTLMEQIVKSNEKPEPEMPTDLRLRQVDEWFQSGEHSRIEDLYKKILQTHFNVEKLTDYISILLKMKKFDESEKAVLQLLQADENYPTGFYLLAFLKTRSNELEIAVLALKVAANLQDRVEFSVLLMMLCEKLGDIEAVQYYEMKLGLRTSETEEVQDETSLENQDNNEAEDQDNNEAEDQFAKMTALYDQALASLEGQITFGLNEFVELTQDFLATRNFDSQKPFVEEKLKILTMAAQGNIDGALKAMESITQDDENEISYKTLKGDLLFEVGHAREAIKEYEVVFNLCLKDGQEAPRNLSLRCGEWFLSVKDCTKAQRYFNYCCKNYPTFESWMGLGLVCYQNDRFAEAEKYFAEANKIDNKSGDNWLYLALVNHKLQRPSKFRACYEIAAGFELAKTDLANEAEEIYFS